MIALPIELERYLDAEYASHKELAKGSVYQLRRSIRIFERWLQRKPTVADLNDSTVSQWLRDASASGEYAARTVHKLRGDILCLWRDAADSGLLEQWPRRVRKVSVPPPEPDAWTIDEVSRLRTAARILPGRLGNGVSRSLYYEAIIATAWDTGLRRGCLWTLPMKAIGVGGQVVLIQEKTGNKIIAQLRPETLSLLQRIGRAVPLEWPHVERVYYFWFAKVKKLADVESDGALQRIRVSATTNIACSNLDDATRFLGHTTSTADKFYLDWKLIRAKTVMPSELPQPPDKQLRLW